MKNYMSVVCVKEKGEQDVVLGLEYKAKSRKSAIHHAQDMLAAARPNLESATWLATTRMKAIDDTGSVYMPVDQSAVDWMMCVDEWVCEKGKDLLPVKMPEADDKPVTVVPPKPVTTPAVTKYNSWSKSLVHPITHKVIMEARDYTHYEYKSGERTEVFK